MNKVNIIDCKTKSGTLTFQFILVIKDKSTNIRNIDIFEELNINLLYLAKYDLCFDKFIYI